jgi:hypothetical protein
MAPTRLRPDPAVSGCTALPLLANATIIEQPVDLVTITRRYTDEAVRFVGAAARVARPFFLYVGYHDVHIPHACEQYCGTSPLGPFGDALLEVRARPHTYAPCVCVCVCVCVYVLVCLCAPLYVRVWLYLTPVLFASL